MKRYEYTTYTCLMSLLFIGIGLFSSCSDEVAVDAGTTTDGLPSLSIVANVDAGIVTRATDPPTDDPATDLRNTNGSWIKNMTVFLFAVDAANGATPLLTKTVQVESNPSTTNQANEIEMVGQDLRKAGIEIGSRVAVYAIANHTLANAKDMTKNQVLSLTGTLPQYRQAGAFYSLVPMTGYVDYTITSTANQTIPLSLKRAVIRIKIDIVDAEFDSDKYYSSQYYWKIESVKLYNDYATTYLWNEGIPTTPGCRTENAGIGTTPGSFPGSDTFSAGTFYLNCNEEPTAHTTPDPIKIKVNGLRGNENSIETPFEYTVDLKRADGTHVFERNTSINATLRLSAGSATLKLNDLPWSEGGNVSSDEKPLNPSDI